MVSISFKLLALGYVSRDTTASCIPPLPPKLCSDHGRVVAWKAIVAATIMVKILVTGSSSSHLLYFTWEGEGKWGKQAMLTSTNYQQISRNKTLQWNLKFRSTDRKQSKSNINDNKHITSKFSENKMHIDLITNDNRYGNTII